MQHRFTATTFLILGGLLVWMTDFVFVYVFVAIACARGFSDASVGGLPIVPVTTLLASLLAGVVTMWLVRRGYQLQRYSESNEHARFIGFVALATGGIAVVALIMLALPAVLVSDPCTLSLRW